MTLDLSNPSILLLTCLAVLVIQAWAFWLDRDVHDFLAFIGPFVFTAAACIGIFYSLYILIRLGLSHHSLFL